MNNKYRKENIMGKKKKKKNTGYTERGGMYNQKRNNEIADHLEAYVDAVQNLFILEGKKEEDVENAIKVVTKAIKNLREGRPDKVFDEDRYNDVFDEDGDDDEGYYF